MYVCTSTADDEKDDDGHKDDDHQDGQKDTEPEVGQGGLGQAEALSPNFQRRAGGIV
jgi:hypothetical protein